MKTLTLSNEALWEAIISGEVSRRNQAFKQIFMDSAMRGKVRSLAAMYNIADVEAEDLLQESIVRLDEVILNGSFRGDSAIITFLIAIVRNKVRDKVKTKNRTVLTDEVKETPDLDQSDTPEAVYLLEEKNSETIKRDGILQTLLGKLKADCQKLLANYYYLGKSMAQVATDQGLANANQAKKAAYRCRQHLKDLIVAEPGLENFLKQTL